MSFVLETLQNFLRASVSARYAEFGYGQATKLVDRHRRHAVMNDALIDEARARAELRAVRGSGDTILGSGDTILSSRVWIRGTPCSTRGADLCMLSPEHEIGTSMLSPEPCTLSRNHSQPATAR